MCLRETSALRNFSHSKMVITALVYYILLDFLYIPVKLMQLVKIILPTCIVLLNMHWSEATKRFKAGDVLCFNYALFTLPKCSPSHRINKYKILTVLSSVLQTSTCLLIYGPSYCAKLNSEWISWVFFFLKYSINTEAHLLVADLVFQKAVCWQGCACNFKWWRRML